MTLRMYADRKKLPLDRVTVEVSHDKVHIDDLKLDTGDEPPAAVKGGKIDVFTRRVFVEGDLDDATRECLLQIADRCPVHRTLEASAHIVTEAG